MLRDNCDALRVSAKTSCSESRRLPSAQPEQIVGREANHQLSSRETFVYRQTFSPASTQPLDASCLNLMFEERETKMLCYRLQSKLFSLLLLSVFSTFLLVTDVVPQQQSKVIEVVDFLGNRRLTDEEILQHIKTRPGELFDATKAQDDLQTLLKLGLFDTSQTRVLTEVGVLGGVYVLFEIRELPLITEVKFEGLRYVTKAELLADLREHKAEVIANNPYQTDKLRKAKQIIMEYLGKKRGFIDAKVDITEEEVSATTLKISFVIDEMPSDDEEDCCEK